MKKFLAREIFPAHIVRAYVTRFRGAEAFPLHFHDFPEFFWISQGAGVHRINGVEQAINAGSLVWVRPQDTHGFGSDERGMVLYNVALEPAFFAGFRRRHFARDRTFWSGRHELPTHLKLAAPQVERLAAEFTELGTSAGDARSAERFLLNALYVCTPPPLPTTAVPGDSAGGRAQPAWMEPALRAFARTEQWSGGSRALARLAGRSEEHVARAVRAATGQSPTDILNSHRMRHAAYLLAATDRKVLDVALECGYESLGHFYTMFHRHYGCSPAVHRRRQPPGSTPAKVKDHSY